MNPLETLIRALMQQAPQRPDLLSEAQGGPSFGSPDYRPTGQRATATFAGRVVQPGETPQDVLKRMPMGSGEGDIGSALKSTLIQAAPFLAKAGIPKIMAMLVPSMRMYHGTPSAFQEVNPALAKSSGLFGPGHYVTNEPAVASEYAQGATHGVSPMSNEQLTSMMKLNPPGNFYSQLDLPQEYSPNIRPYQVAEHNTFMTNQPVAQADIDRLAASASKVAGEGRRAQNAAATVRSNAGELGKKVWQSLADFMGPEKANQAMLNAGFQSISYPGGDIMGTIPHQARNVLDPSIMQNLFDALTGKPKP